MDAVEVKASSPVLPSAACTSTAAMSDDLSWASPCSSCSTSPSTATTGHQEPGVLQRREHGPGARPPGDVLGQCPAQAQGRPRRGRRRSPGPGWSGPSSSGAAVSGRGSSWGTAPLSRRCGVLWDSGGVDGTTWAALTAALTVAGGDLDVDRVPTQGRGQRAACARLHPAARRRVADRHAGDGRRDRGIGHRLGDRPGLRRASPGRASAWPAWRRAVRGQRLPARPPARPRPGRGQPAPSGVAREAPELARPRLVVRHRRVARPSTTTWPTSRRCCASGASSERRLRRPQPAVVAARRRRSPPCPSPRPTPIAVVDLDAFDANADDLVRRAGGKPVRVASKSLRVPALISRAPWRTTASPASWPTPSPRRSGCTRPAISDDIVVAYPTRRRGRAAPPRPRPRCRRRDHVDGRRPGPPRRRRRCTRSHGRTGQVGSRSTSTPGCGSGGQHIGPKRSPLFDTADVVALARRVVERDGFRLVGVMTYEGQVAGVQDDVPEQRTKSLLVRRLKQASMAQLEVRRREIAEALRRGRRAGVLERRRLRVRRGHGRRCRRHRDRRRLGTAGARDLRPLRVLRAAPGGVLRPPGRPASRRRPWPPCTAAASSPAARPGRTAPRCRGHRPGCT